MGHPVDADELPVKPGMLFQCLVDSLSLANKICIQRAHNDSSVVRGIVVQGNEVLAIEGNYCPTLFCGKCEYVFVSYRLLGLASFKNCSYVVT